MVRKGICYGVGVCLALFAVLAATLVAASPGPQSQVILGVGIGSYDRAGGIAYLSGRRLDCTLTGAEAATCTVELAGERLEIRARRNLPTDPDTLGGVCEAFYNGQAWPCRIGNRHIHIGWFAYLDEPLGLDGAQLASLRRRYFFENLPEQSFFTGAIVTAITLPALIGLMVGAALWPRRRDKVSVALLAVVAGALALPAALMISFRLIYGFWD